MRAPARPVLIVLAIASLAGCTDVPPRRADLSAGDRDAPYPALIPAHRITGRVPPPPSEARTAEDLDARADRLRARAARLKGPVIDDTTRDRMRSGIDR
ncbi:hypothetical protein [Roseovarius sp. D22-M7]|uniref:hypothetical protein n=1 Tax=Roseovarius sp. D22-M7 TaxID=3127116 RepID=UPI00300FC018